MAPTSNQQQQSLLINPMPQRDRRVMHHKEDQSLGTGGEIQYRGGQRRGEEAQETPEDDEL